MKVYVVISGYTDYEGGGDEIHAVYEDYDDAVKAVKAMGKDILPYENERYEEKEPFDDDYVFYMAVGEEHSYYKGLKEMEVIEKAKQNG